MAYKFQQGAAKLNGAIESTGQVKATSMDAQEGNITNVGAIQLDSLTVDTAGVGLNIDGSGADTGLFKITMDNNVASGLAITDGSVDFLKFVTTNSSEQIDAGENLNMASGKIIKMNGTEMLNANGAAKVNAAVAGDGIQESSGVLSLDLKADFGLEIVSQELAIKFDGTTLAKGTNGIKVGDGQIGFTQLKTSDIETDLAVSANPAKIARADAVKAYVDAQVSGLDVKASVRAAVHSTYGSGNNGNVAGTYNNGAGTITATGNGALGAIDGVTLTTGNRVLLWKQSSAFQNGVYTVTAVGDGSNPYVLTRATDFDAASEFSGAPFFMVEEGTEYKGHGFVCSDPPATLGTNAANFYKFSSPTDGIAESNGGLSRSGNAIKIDQGNLTAANINVANDLFAFFDADDSNNVKKESIADLVAAMDGDGLAATSGVLAIDIVASNPGLTFDSGKIDTKMKSDGGLTKDANGLMILADSSGGLETHAGGLRLKAAVAGDGLAHTSGVLSLDLNELTAATVNVAADSLAIIDADGNVTRKESIADLVAEMAGGGLSASNGVLSSAGSVVSNFADANADLAVGFNFGTTTLTANRTLTLPASGGLSGGEVIYVKAPADVGDFKVTIQKASSGATQNIDGLASIDLETDSAAVSLIYVGSNTWAIF